MLHLPKILILLHQIRLLWSPERSPKGTNISDDEVLTVVHSWFAGQLKGGFSERIQKLVERTKCIDDQDDYAGKLCVFVFSRLSKMNSAARRQIIFTCIGRVQTNHNITNSGITKFAIQQTFCKFLLSLCRWYSSTMLPAFLWLAYTVFMCFLIFVYYHKVPSFLTSVFNTELSLVLNLDARSLG